MDLCHRDIDQWVIQPRLLPIDDHWFRIRLDDISWMQVEMANAVGTGRPSLLEPPPDGIAPSIAKLRQETIC